MPFNNSRVEAVLDELAVLQQNFIQKSGELLEAVDDDLSTSSYFLEELNVIPSDVPQMSLHTDGAHLLPPIMTLKRKFMSNVKLAMANANDVFELRDAVRNIRQPAKYKLTRSAG
ncbi:hypothetical protein [Alteromonas gracilis]|uniref:hypothetical protein n=1 Tax=Alteromonas gracilis TaxID=1479524 RepID=UPI003734CD08